MLFVLWVPLLLQLAIPVSLLLWLAFGRPGSLASWLARVILVTCYLVAIAIAGLWLMLPWYTPLLYGVGLILAVLRSLPDRTLPLGPRDRRGMATVLLGGSLAVCFAGLALYILMGWRMPPDTFELGFPLRDGTYLVVNGGRNALVNAHFKTLEGERFRLWRGQSYGVDIEKINGYGLRARGILPADPARYAIFGEPLYAPCAGTVIQAVDGLPEMSPPRIDRRHLAGNHVILRCDSVWVLLGHLQRGTIRISAGDSIEEGRWLGRVGNTGNSGEPHLHIHAQTPGTAAAPLSGEPLAVRFGDRYPVRNARIKVGGSGGSP